MLTNRSKPDQIPIISTGAWAAICPFSGMANNLWQKRCANAAEFPVYWTVTSFSADDGLPPILKVAGRPPMGAYRRAIRPETGSDREAASSIASSNAILLGQWASPKLKHGVADYSERVKPCNLCVATWPRRCWPLPCAGHSTLQGDRTCASMKGRRRTPDRWRRSLVSSRHAAMATTREAIHAMLKGESPCVCLALGGNFAQARPDSVLTHQR